MKNDRSYPIHLQSKIAHFKWARKENAAAKQRAYKTFHFTTRHSEIIADKQKCLQNGPSACEDTCTQAELHATHGDLH